MITCARESGRPARTGLAVAVLMAVTWAVSWAVPQRAQAEVTVELLRFLEGWQAAWSSHDLATYLDAYASDAVVSSRSRPAFDDHKRRLFEGGAPPAITIGDVTVSGGAGESGLLQVEFFQDYRSEKLSDFGRKTLSLRRDGAGFVIVRETWAPAAGSIERSLADHLSVLEREEADAAAADVASAAPATQPSTAPSTQSSTASSTQASTAPSAQATSGPAVADEATPDATADEDAGEPLAPLVGGDYVPPAGVAVDDEGVDDLLDLKPIVPAPRSVPAEIPGLPSGEDGRRIIEEIVARVNGRIMTRSMFINRIELHHEQLLEQQPADMSERLRLLPQETLETTIERWLILDEAEARQADLDMFWRDWLEASRRQVGAESLQELRQLMEEQGADFDELKDRVIEQEVPALLIQQEVAERIDLSEHVLTEYHQAHLADYRRPARVTLRQIFLPTSSPTELPRARQAAEAAIQRLASGDAWCAVEAIYGPGDPPCGDVGEVELPDLLPALREPAAGLPIDAVSKPIESSAGLHVLQVTAREEVEDPPFEEVADDVRSAVFEDSFNRQLDEFLGDLRRRAIVEVNQKYASLLPEYWANPVSQ